MIFIKMTPLPESLNITRFETLLEFLNFMLDFVMSFAVLLAVVFVVVTGFSYILSFGDENKIQKANKSLVFTLVGLAVCLTAPLVIRFILQDILGTS